MVPARPWAGITCAYREPLHRFDVLGFRGAVLLGPARDLALEVASLPPEVGEPEGPPVDLVQARHRLGHPEVDRPPLRGRHPGQGVVREDAAHEPLHEVEGRPDHVPLPVQEDGARHRNARPRQGGQDPVLAIHRVGGREDAAGGLLAQHHRAPVDRHEEGGVRLAARDPLEHQPAPKPGDGAAEEGLQAAGIEVQGSGPGRGGRGRWAHG